MKIFFSKIFIKNYKKLNKNQQLKVDQVLDIFQEDPFTRSLKNHKLQGKYSQQSSISVSHDIRIVFEEKDDYFEVLLLRVGGHSKVYE